MGAEVQVVALGRSQMELTNFVQVREVIRQLRPNIIINAAAYTAVDAAEQAPEMALCINAEAVGVIALEARRCGAALIHYSSDYVFDGTKDSPYVETDITCPVNAYGRSKLAGEEAIKACGVAHLILRTSWVYGMRGSNFLTTVQRLTALQAEPRTQPRAELAIVADQFGAPTWARTLAQYTAQMIAGLCQRSQHDAATKNALKVPQICADTWQQYGGVYHLTAQGHTTWHGFASAIVHAGPHAPSVTVKPIVTEEHPSTARRPRNSRLSCARYLQEFGDLPTWDTALACCLREAPK